MKSMPHFIFTIVCLVAVVHASANDSPSGLSLKKGKVPQPVARTHDELGQLFAAAIDKEDYEMVVQLMAPVAGLRDMGESEKEQKAYLDYLSGILKQAKQYREYLRKNDLLPLKGKNFQKFKDDDRSKRQINGKTFQCSTGIRLIDEKGKVGFELVDQAIAIDGRWYISRLCVESVEKEIKKEIKER